jgi:hypothetical protein
MPVRRPDIFSSAQRLVVTLQRTRIEDSAIESICVLEADALTETHSALQTHKIHLMGL